MLAGPDPWRPDICATAVQPQIQPDDDVGFIGDGAERIFVATSVPAGRPVAGLLICSPLDAEFMTNYRREVVLARRLRDAGWAVVRFHYRGAGHSDGDPREMTFERILEDARTAARHLRERVGDAPVAFLGTRFGALVAASASRDQPGATLVLWEPVLTTTDHFREAERAARVAGFTDTGVPADQPANGSRGEAVGFALQPLLQAEQPRTLAEELTGQRRVLIVRMSRRRRQAVDDLAGTLPGDGVEVVDVHDEQAWWMASEIGRPVEARIHMPLIDTTAAWLERASCRS